MKPHRHRRRAPAAAPPGVQPAPAAPRNPVRRGTIRNVNIWSGVMSRRRRTWRWLLAIAAGLVVAVAFPSVAATTCPGCYGMIQVRPGLYLEPGLPPTRERQVAEVIDAANRRVADFYGGRRSSPDILVCATTRCYQKIGGGGERG